MYMEYTTRKVLVMEWIEVSYDLSSVFCILAIIVQYLYKQDT